ncbi:MAG: SDR family oxidoreductase [Pseudomonadota bacterium]
MSDLSGKAVVVTGASRGIGAATVQEFARQGAKVVLAARSSAEIEALADQISTEGGTAIACACDVSQYDQVANLVDVCQQAFGRVDVLVNNAGVIEPIARLAASNPEHWARAADINYKGVYFGLRAALPIMVAQGSGVVVNVSSGAATSALEGWSHYCSSKAAVLSLTRCAYKEYGTQGIRVVGLSPGTVATEMQVAIKASGINPVSQLDPAVHSPPEWAARAIAWLCTDAASDLSGVDFSLKDPAGRRRVGLPA